jgi:hypothetical protein
MVLSRIQLDHAGCSAPDCAHDHSVVYLHGACHVKAGVEAAYSKATGTLKITCAKCHKFVAEIAVAAE